MCPPPSASCDNQKYPLIFKLTRGKGEHQPIEHSCPEDEQTFLSCLNPSSFYHSWPFLSVDANSSHKRLLEYFRGDRRRLGSKGGSNGWEDHPFDSDTFTSFVDVYFSVYIQQSTRKPLIGDLHQLEVGAGKSRGHRLMEKAFGPLD